MTEAEWLKCDDPRAMLACVRGASTESARKKRLFVCACCRGVWQWLEDDQRRRTVEGWERLADDSCAPDADAVLSEVRCPTVGTAFLQSEPGALPYVTVGKLVGPTTIVCLIMAMKIFVEIPADCSGVIVETCVENDDFVEYASPLVRLMPTLPQTPSVGAESRQAALVRDIFPYPRRLTYPPVRTRDVLAVAQAAYTPDIRHSGELDGLRLNVLADSLEDAGCTDEAILTHLRSPGPHVRGCWAVDLVLGKQ